MNDNRRSLESALSIKPEAMAFIRGSKGEAPAAAPSEVPPEKVAKQRIEKTERRGRPAAKPIEPTPDEDLPNDVLDDDPFSDPEPTRRRRPSADRPPVADPRLLASLNTRISQETARNLKRAYFERKMNFQEPSTLQEIVELALREWLKRNGAWK